MRIHGTINVDYTPFDIIALIVASAICYFSSFDLLYSLITFSVAMLISESLGWVWRKYG